MTTQTNSDRPAIKHAPDLTQRPPRSLRCKLGGYAILPRLLDKCRASIVGTNGDYSFNCPLDQEFLTFTGIAPELIKEQVAAGLNDDAIIEWVAVNCPNQNSSSEIEQWSLYQNERKPEQDTEAEAYFIETRDKLSQTRKDIITWADLLDLDDYRTLSESH